MISCFEVSENNQSQYKKQYIDNDMLTIKFLNQSLISRSGFTYKIWYIYIKVSAVSELYSVPKYPRFTFCSINLYL